MDKLHVTQSRLKKDYDKISLSLDQIRDITIYCLKKINRNSSVELKHRIGKKNYLIFRPGDAHSRPSIIKPIGYP
ncbi:MAG: hypothetical protein IIA60_09035 [Candidatus Marinimicrobia bacterium]|nr:hypothetical protein [Candidatus Neomarinimicrobiota bacterium]